MRAGDLRRVRWGDHFARRAAAEADSGTEGQDFDRGAAGWGDLRLEETGSTRRHCRRFAGSGNARRIISRSSPPNLPSPAEIAAEADLSAYALEIEKLKLQRGRPRREKYGSSSERIGAKAPRSS